MTKNDERRCDVCGEIIPKGQDYSATYITPEAASIFMETKDLELAPTWTHTDGGKIRMDICLDCKIGMGHIDKTGNA